MPSERAPPPLQRPLSSGSSRAGTPSSHPGSSDTRTAAALTRDCTAPAQGQLGPVKALRRGRRRGRTGRDEAPRLHPQCRPAAGAFGHHGGSEPPPALTSTARSAELTMAAAILPPAPPQSPPLAVYPASSPAHATLYWLSVSVHFRPTLPIGYRPARNTASSLPYWLPSRPQLLSSYWLPSLS